MQGSLAFRESDTLARVVPSATLAISDKARELRRNGENVISLSQGEPDFDTPQHIKDAAIAAIVAGKTKYTAVDGLPELKESICRKFRRENGLAFEPSNINVSPGGKAVIFNALAATLNPGDEVLIPAPCWVSYPDMVRLAGGEPVIVETGHDRKFKLTSEELRAAITARTKCLILNSPSNPTGAVYSKRELQALGEVLQEFPQVWILSDDMYEHLIYDGLRFETIAACVPELLPRTLTVNGVSKAYAMTGWRIGYAGGPAPLIKAMAKVMSQTTSNASSISQWAAVAALDAPLDFLEERNAMFNERRELAVEILNRSNGLDCHHPDGAFYIYVSCQGAIGKRTNVGQIINDDTGFAAQLLRDQAVAVVPGVAFCQSPYFRISFSVDTELLREACLRIERFCDSLHD